MLEALEGPKTRGQVAQVRTIPIPVNGWSTRDKYTSSFSREALRYAPIIDNWMVVDGRLAIRPGFTTYATGMTDPVHSLMEYSGPTGTRKLFAATYAAGSACKIWDVTSSGAATSLFTGLVGAKWQHTMFATTGGNYLVMADGDDAVKAYDGTSWTTPALTGVTSANIIHVCNHKGRLWLTEKSTLKAWYLPAFAITGTVSSFDLGAFCTKGGYLMAVASWSVDGGNGPDDMIVFISSEGQVVVYAGLDPNSVDEWTLVGVYNIDKPVGRRCFVKFGADLAVYTESGIVSLSQVLASVTPRDAWSDPIRSEFLNSVGLARASFGWEIVHYTSRGFVMANVPQSVGTSYHQYVFNPLMKAWFRFKGMNAFCWAQSNQYMYFGGTGNTYIWDNGQTDDDGANVEADIAFAWWNYGTGSTKTFVLMCPHYFTDGDIAPLAEMRVDYDETPPTSTGEPSTALTGATWDDFDWDVADWAGDLVPVNEWLTADGEGVIGAPRILMANLTAQIALVGIEVAFIDGGLL